MMTGRTLSTDIPRPDVRPSIAVVVWDSRHNSISVGFDWCAIPCNGDEECTDFPFTSTETVSCHAPHGLRVKKGRYEGVCDSDHGDDQRPYSEGVVLKNERGGNDR